MKDTIKTPEIKPKKKVLPYIFKKPSSLKNEKDKIQEICKKLYGHKILKECTKYKAVQKLLEIQTKHVEIIEDIYEFRNIINNIFWIWNYCCV